MSFDYVPRDTLIHKMDPRVKLLFIITFMIFFISLDDSFTLMGLTVVFLFLIAVSKVPFRRVVSIAKALIPAIALYVPLNMLFLAANPRQMQVFGRELILVGRLPIVNIPVYLQGVIYTFNCSLRMFVILLLFRWLLMITPVNRLVVSLVKLGMSPGFSVATSIAFAYLPVVLREARTIQEAQAVRAFKTEYRNPFKKIKALSMLLYPMMMNSFRRGYDIAMALEARAFNYDPANRTSIEETKYTKTDWLFTAIFVMLIVVAILLGRWGFNYANIDLTMRILEWLGKMF